MTTPSDILSHILTTDTVVPVNAGQVQAIDHGDGPDHGREASWTLRLLLRPPMTRGQAGTTRSTITVRDPSGDVPEADVELEIDAEGAITLLVKVTDQNDKPNDAHCGVGDAVANARLRSHETTTPSTYVVR